MLVIARGVPCFALLGTNIWTIARVLDGAPSVSPVTFIR